MIRFELYKFVDRKYLLAIFNKNLFDLKDCCKECLYCEKRKTILKKFQYVGFDTFNRNVDFWEFYNEDLGIFSISPF